MGSDKRLDRANSRGPHKRWVGKSPSTSVSNYPHDFRSYYHSEVGLSQPLKEQSGTVRTNCMDNLDRTNVAQSAIAKWMLDQQLRDIGVFEESETVETYDRFMYMFRNSKFALPLPFLCTCLI